MSILGSVEDMDEAQKVSDETSDECPRCGSIMCDGCYPAPVEYPGFELPLPEDDA